MRKIIIISSTNRPGSNTMKVSRIYSDILKAKNIDNEILGLEILPETITFTELHGNRTKEYNKLINDHITNNSKFIFVVPEYNGSFPGILKVFLDSVPPKEWTDKYACLVGVSLGRAGNLRGMDHLTGILNYLKMHVYHNKLPISTVDKLLDENNVFGSDAQLNTCKNQLDGFLNWAKSE